MNANKKTKDFRTQSTLIKLPLKEIVKQQFDVRFSREEEINNEYLIAQGNSPLFDQIERLRGRKSLHI